MSAVEAAAGLDTCQEAGGVAALPHRASELAEKGKYLQQAKVKIHTSSANLCTKHVGCQHS